MSNEYRTATTIIIDFNQKTIFYCVFIQAFDKIHLSSSGITTDRKENHYIYIEIRLIDTKWLKDN